MAPRLPSTLPLRHRGPVTAQPVTHAQRRTCRCQAASHQSTITRNSLLQHTYVAFPAPPPAAVSHRSTITTLSPACRCAAPRKPPAPAPAPGPRSAAVAAGPGPSAPVTHVCAAIGATRRPPATPARPPRPAGPARPGSARASDSGEEGRPAIPAATAAAASPSCVSEPGRRAGARESAACQPGAWGGRGRRAGERRSAAAAAVSVVDHGFGFRVSSE